jgi:hypothetical protein
MAHLVGFSTVTENTINTSASSSDQSFNYGFRDVSRPGVQIYAVR